MDVMKGLIAQRVRKRELFYSALCNKASNKYKGIHRKNENHPIYLQPTAREGDGRGCWGVALMKTAKLRQWECSGGRREGQDCLTLAEEFDGEHVAMRSMTKEIIKAS